LLSLLAGLLGRRPARDERVVERFEARLELVGDDRVTAKSAEVDLGWKRLPAVPAGNHRAGVGRRSAAVRAEVGAHEKRRAAAAPRGSGQATRCGCGSEEKRVELVHALLDLQDITGAFDQKLGTKAVAADHLDGQAAHVPNFGLSPPDERAALAAQPARMRNRLGRRGSLGDELLDDDLPRLRRRRRNRLGRRLRTPSTRPGHMRRV
jgi:hypothetical protein